MFNFLRNRKIDEFARLLTQREFEVYKLQRALARKNRLIRKLRSAGPYAHQQSAYSGGYRAGFKAGFAKGTASVVHDALVQEDKAQAVADTLTEAPSSPVPWADHAIVGTFHGGEKA